MIKLYTTYLKLLVEEQSMNAENHQYIKKVVSVVFEFLNRARLYKLDFNILKLLYEYSDKYELERDSYIYYYFLQLLEFADDTSVDLSLFTIKKEDYLRYRKLLEEDTFTNKKYYEELIQFELI